MNSSGRKNSQSYAQASVLYSRKVGGNGVDFVVLHGLFGSGKNWRSFAGSLEQNFQVWTLDARNHGDSPHADSMSYQEMAEDVVRFLLITNWKTSFSLVTAWVEKQQCDLRYSFETGLRR